MKTKTILATLIVLPFALAIAADEPSAAKPRRDPAQVFKAFDRDADGFVSLEEYKAGTAGHIDPSRVGSVFKKKDSDGDGKLNLTEFMFVPPREAAKPISTPEPSKKAKKE
jgi:hypothetical protein